MQESRKKFIEFAKKEGLSLQTGNSGYVNINTQVTLRAWDTAWAASRAAIEIELPEACSCCYSESEKEWHDSVMGEVSEHLRAAGLKIKGDTK